MLNQMMRAGAGLAGASYRTLAIGAAVGLCVSASAQNARVYVANSSNSRVVQASFEALSSTVVIDDANRLTQVRDIAFRDDGLKGLSLLVCDRNGGQVVFYAGAAGAGQIVVGPNTGAGPSRPDGMSLDAAGNIFVMNSGQGGSAGPSEAWVVLRDLACVNPSVPGCVAGGYRAGAGLIDRNVAIRTEISGLPVELEAESLSESLVVPGTSGVLGAGDLLVLTHPGALIRYRGSDVAAFIASMRAGQIPASLTPETVIHPAESSAPDDEKFPPGVDPHGMAFAPGGGLLVVVSDGRVLMYGTDGRRKTDGAGAYVDFITGDGQDEFKIAVGLQDGKNRAFITRQQRGELRRYNIGPDGRGTLDSIIADLQVPVGVDATNSNTVPAFAGNNVNVEPTTVMSSKFEQVTVGGFVNATVTTFTDPREAEVATPANQPLHRSLFLNEIRADLPAIEIPAYARAFPFDNPNSGTPTFILIEAESSVGVNGLIDHYAIEEPLLGYDPNCADPDVTKQPFMFWCPDADDPPIVEGQKFIDVTTGCGSIRGLTRNMSYFLVGVRITKPMPALATDKLGVIRQVITDSACIDKLTKRKLLSLMDRADRDMSRAKYASVISTLNEIDAIVEASPKAFGTCTVNLAAEIQARARSANFTLTKCK